MNIYLDYNSTARAIPEVLDSILPLMYRPANPSSIHKYGREAKSLIEDARKTIMNYLGINQISHDVIFTSSGTESNNFVLNSFKGYHAFIGATEHASVLKCSDFFQKYSIVPVDRDGIINLNALERLLASSDSEKRIISVAHANNETGVIQDIRKIADIAHKYGAVLHSDMIQSFGKIQFNFKDLDIDIATISSHKIGGLHGASAVVKKSDVQLSNLLYGGGQERGFRAGTENTYAIASFAEAVKLIENTISKFEEIKKVRDYMEDQLLSFVPDIKIYSKESNRLPNTSYIAMPGVDHQTQVMLFDLKGFSVSAGAACSSGVIKNSHVLEAMDVDDRFIGNAVRVSLGWETTKKEIDQFIISWKEVYTQLSPKTAANVLEVLYV